MADELYSRVLFYKPSPPDLHIYLYRIDRQM